MVCFSQQDGFPLAKTVMTTGAHVVLKQLREPLNWSEIGFDNKGRGECLDQTGTRAAHSSV